MLTLVGTSHRTAPIEARERLAIPGDDLPAVLDRLGARFGSGAIVNTCNRIEMYLPGIHSREAVLDFFIQEAGSDPALAQQYFTASYGTDAIRHLYGVAAGIDSMVLGESEVLGQVRTAFSASVAAGTDSALLSRLFHTAIRTGRRARVETTIGHHALSVSSIAVQQARALCGELEHATVLVLGAGEAGQLAAAALVEHGVREVLVVNRTQSRAEALAAQLGGRALALDDLVSALAQTDIVLAAADAPEPLVTTAIATAALAQRPARELVVIDIGMPRDCDPEIGDLKGISYYDLDDLQAIAAEHFAARASEVAHVEAIVEEEAERFVTWWGQLQVTPTISALTEHAEAVRQAEIAKSLRRMRLDDEQRTQLDALTRAIVKRLLHDPISALRERGDREEYVDTVRTLFHLDGPASEPDQRDNA